MESWHDSGKIELTDTVGTGELQFPKGYYQGEIDLVLVGIASPMRLTRRRFPVEER